MQGREVDERWNGPDWKYLAPKEKMGGTDKGGGRGAVDAGEAKMEA